MSGILFETQFTSCDQSVLVVLIEELMLSAVLTFVYVNR